MRITLSAIHINDQEEALTFYTQTLGFVKKQDLRSGDFRWLSVSTDTGNSLELVLEPNTHPAAQAYQKALYADGIPVTSLEVDNIKEMHNQLLEKGVRFKMPPTDVGSAWIAIFDDTCGNWVQIHTQN